MDGESDIGAAHPRKIDCGKCGVSLIDGTGNNGNTGSSSEKAGEERYYIWYWDSPYFTRCSLFLPLVF